MTTALVPIAAPANWRHAYIRTRCTICGDRGLFHKDTPLPVCDGCWRLNGTPPGLATETFLSDILYHGDARGDYAR